MDSYYDIASRAIIELGNEEDVDALEELKDKIEVLLAEINK